MLRSLHSPGTDSLKIEAMPTSIDSIEVKIDGQTAEAWDGILAQFDDASIYQTWAYGAVRWGCNNLSHLILQRGDSILAAAQLRIVRVPFLPGGIAYVRWGPLWQLRNEAKDPSVFRMAVRYSYFFINFLTL